MTRRAGKRPAARKPAPRATRKKASPSIRYYPNDPDASVGLIDVPPPTTMPGEPPYVIEGRRYAPAAYAPGTLAFQQWQGEASLSRTIRVWEQLFDRGFTAWHSGAPLRVRLRAGQDLNAFYDRKSLQFFYDTDRLTGRAVYAAESLDIVAHEAGHAILDVYQPGYWSLPDPETAAFHEAFADCSSLLVTLDEPAVRSAFLAEAGRALRSSNLVSRLAEALGRAIYDNYGPGSVADPTRLRDANNRFRYDDPLGLPPRGEDSTLTSEPHSLSRVFSGAFYDLLVGLLADRLRREGGPETVAWARRRAGRLLARAVETLPPGEARFAAIGARMMEIDATESDGEAAKALARGFARHGLPLAARARRGRIAFTALRALDPDRPGGRGALRAALGLPAGARLQRRAWPARIGGGIREQWVHHHAIEVPASLLGRGRSLVVDVACGCTLTRGPAGDVEGMTLRDRRDPTPRDLLRWLRPWMRREAIAWRGGAPESAVALFRKRKVFRVTAGNRLERVYAD